MINRHPADIVSIRKIYLKIWKLRHEIEFFIKNDLKNNKKQNDIISILQKKYKPSLDTASPDSTQEKSPFEAKQCIRGITILSENTMDAVYFFSNMNLQMGESIIIEYCIPKIFRMHAEILSSHPYNSHDRIISKQRYAYRAKAKFTFLSKVDRIVLRNFIRSIETE